VWKLLGRRRRWEVIIKMDLIDGGCEDERHRIVPSGGL